MTIRIHTSRLLLLLVGLRAMTIHAAGQPSTSDLRGRSLSWLEHRLGAIDDELASLAHYSIRSGTGSIGYRSQYHAKDEAKEWITIDFGTEHTLDEVVLVPVIRRDAQTGFQADGFPRHFRLIAGTRDDRKGRVIAEYTDAQQFLPRIAPLSIPCHGIAAAWIRIEAERLSLRAFDEHYVFQLSEIMAFSGRDNVALRQTIKSRSNRQDGLAWRRDFLVDGAVPYLMDAANGEKSVAFLSRMPTNKSPSLTIDLGVPRPVSRLHLHAVDPSDVLPQPLTSDFAIPHNMRLEAAGRSDFSDATTLTNLHLETIYDMAPIMMWRLPATTNRFFRLRIDTPGEDPRFASRAPRFGFAEIELRSNGTNHALGKTITGTDLVVNPNRSLSLLTDGRNMYGTILSMRDWMEQLSRRHNLETERPRIEAELNRRYEKQKTNLRRLGWLSALLAAGIGFTILIDRLLRMRQIRSIEQRFAADLHDELGANLHTIGLLSDLAENAKGEPDELGMLLRRIRAVTERSGIAVRNCTDMLSAEGLNKELLADMRRAAQRILPQREHTLSIEGEDHLALINRRTCFDLFMFYKECLVNISRHSGATHLSTQMRVTPREIALVISDNGCGLPESGNNAIPSSLKRRARLLRAKIHVERPPGGGTRVNLNLHIRKWTPFTHRGKR